MPVTPSAVVTILGWVLLAALAPLAFSASAAATFFTAKLLPVYTGCALLGVGAALRAYQAKPALLPPLRTRRRSWIPGALALGFLAVGGASVAASSSVATSVLGTYNQGTGWLFWVAALGGWYALSRSGLGGPLRRALLVGLVCAALVVALLAVLQALQWEPLRFRLGFRADRRAGSTLGNPLYAGAFLALATVVALDCARRARSAFGTAASVAAAGILVLGVGVTWSRGAWLALAVGATVWAVRALPGRVGRRRVLIPLGAVAGIGLVVALGVVPALAPARGAGETKAAEVADPGSTVETRLLMWSVAADAVRDRPWLGWGPNGYRFGAQAHMSAEKLELEPFSRDADAHSLFFELAATWGVPALLLLLGWFVWLGSALFSSRLGGEAPVAAGVLAAFLAGSLTMPQNLVVTPVALGVVGLALAGANGRGDGGRRGDAGGEGISAEDDTPSAGGRDRVARLGSVVATALLAVTVTVGSWTWYQADRHYLRGEITGDLGELAVAAEGFPFVDAYWRSRGMAETREGSAQARLALVEQGVASLGRSLRVSPRDMDTLTTLTAVYLQRGEWEEAREYAERAVSFSAVEPLPHAQLAYALLRLGEPGDARTEAESALAVDVQSARVLHTVGLYLRDSGDLGGARAVFERALSVDPGFAPAQRELERLP